MSANLRILAYAPKHGPYDEGHHEREEVTHAVVIRASPVSQVGLPETGYDLGPEGLRVLCWKIQVFRSSSWDTQRLH